MSVVLIHVLLDAIVSDDRSVSDRDDIVTCLHFFADMILANREVLIIVFARRSVDH